MCAFWRWFKAEKAPAAIAPLRSPDPAPTIVASTPRRVPVPPEALGLERHESRSHPGRYYYRNAIPELLPGLPSIKGDAFFSYEVAGDSYYQETLEEIVGGRRSAAVYFRVIAILSSEPENSHDRNAVAVRINGAIVGHIKKQDCIALRDQLDALGVSGDVQCRAEIAGGWDHGSGDVGKFGLKLDLTFPLDVRSVRKPPTPRKTR